MNDDGAVQTTIEFDLPCGIEKDGQVHRHVTMRRLKNSDFMKVNGDQRVRQLAREDLSVTSSNPLQLMRTQDALNQMYSVLYTQVVLNIGDLGKLTKADFDDFWARDREVMMAKFEELNEIKKDAGGDQAFPFGLGGK